MRPEINAQRFAPRGGVTRTSVIITILLSLVAGAVTAQAAEPVFARMETDAGPITLVFYPELAPYHVDNFVHLSRTGFLDGTRFHRIIPGFVIQGGDPNSKDMDPRNDGLGGPNMSDVLTDEEMAQVTELMGTKGYTGVDAKVNLKEEFSKTVKHVRGTLSMARSQHVDSAGSQFFICVDTTTQLDGKYTIFGYVISGMEVADTIVNAEKNPSGRDAPLDPVAIKKMTIIEGTDGLNEVEKAAWEALPPELQSAK